MFRLRARVDKALQEDRDLSKLLVQEAANLASKSDHEYGNLLNKVIASRGTAASYIAEVRPELLDAEGLKHASKHDDAAQELVARYLTARENTDYADIDKKITAGFVTAILNNTNVAISTASTAPKTLIDTLKMQSTEDTEQDPSRFRFMRVTQELKPSTLELFMHTQEEAARYLAENHPEMLVHNSSLNVILQVMQYNKDFAVLFAESGIGTLKCANPLDVIRDYEYSTGEMITEYTKDPMRRRNAQLLIDVLIGNDELTQALIDKHPEFFEM
ncbi:MAG: hypothetical protein KGH62_06105, partial [Candidatus Micrarchaeota archaeon]|nr:hypothetical protein [Candidatus Micrarchaeota archaeon]